MMRFVAALAVAGALAAWLAPAPKPEAVLGRLAYGQFLAAAALSAIAAALAVVACMPRRWRKPAAFRAGAVGLGLTAALVAWEIAAKLIAARSQAENPFYSRAADDELANPELPYIRPKHLNWTGMSFGDLNEGKPDLLMGPVTFRTDHQGFRNATDRDRADVVFVGDSFTEAGNVADSDTFVERVAAAREWTARNLGRAGYGPPSELVVLRDYALPCRPKWIVWQIAESNDLFDAWSYQRWRSQLERSPDAQPELPTVDSGARRRYSPTFLLFRALARCETRRLEGVFPSREHGPVSMRFYSEVTKYHRAAGNPGWPPTETALMEGARLAREGNARLIVLLIPMKIRVYGDLVRWSAAARPTPLVDLPRRASLGYALEQRCRELGVPFLDATEPLRSAVREGDLVYFPLDTHLSPAGHQVVAELVVEAIRQAGDEG
jgi:hypothetical protein